MFFLGMKFGGVWVNVVNLYSTIIFEEEVMNSKEDCVVQFYSDSCDHCTKRMKRLEKAASLFADDDSIKFFKFSSNTNDIDIEGIYVG